MSQKRTPAREADTEYVLHRSRLTGRRDCPVHLPSEDDPDTPRCSTRRQSGKGYYRLAVDKVPDSWCICGWCDPDYEVDRHTSQRGKTLASKLYHADPDDVGRKAMEASD